jgi:hypothetical protein
MAENRIDLEVRAKALLGDAQKQISQFLGELEKKTESVGKTGAVSMGKLQEAFKNPLQGARQLSGELSGSLLTSLATVGVAATATAGFLAAVGAAAIAAAREAATVGGALDDMSEITGISVERLSHLKFAAEVAGTSMEQLTNVIFMMQQRMEKNPEDFAQGLNRIGLSLREIEALSPDEQFMAIAEAFRSAGPEVNKTATAIELFGRQGRDIIPLLNEDLKGLVERSRELGMEWSGQDAAAAEDLGRKSRELGLIWKDLYTDIGRAFIPMLTSLLGAINDVSGVVISATKWFGDHVLMVDEITAAYKEAAGWIHAARGELGEIPKVASPKPWQDLKDNGLQPVVLTEREITQIIKDQEKAIKDRQAAAKRAADEAKRQAEERRRQEELFAQEEARVDNRRREAATQAEAEGRARQERLRAFEQAARDDTARQVQIQADREKQIEQDKQDAIITSEIDAYRKRAELREQMLDGFKSTFNSMVTAVQGSFAQMMLRTKSFKEGFLDIWQSIKAGFLNNLNQLLGMFVNQFLKGMLNAMTGSQGGFASAFSGLFGGGGGGLPGLPGGGGGGGLGNLGGLFGRGGGGGFAIPGGIQTDINGNLLTQGGGLGNFARFGGGSLMALAGAMQFMKPGRQIMGGLQAGAGIGTMVAPGIGTLIGAGVGALAGWIKGLGGPSQKELEGRAVTQQFKDLADSLLTDIQRIEAGGEAWKKQVILVRDAYLKVGKSEQEALSAVERLWKAEKEGAGATQAALEPIIAAIEMAGQQSQESAAQTVEAQAQVEEATKRGMALWEEYARRGGVVGPQIANSLRSALSGIPGYTGQIASQIDAILSGITVDPIEIPTVITGVGADGGELPPPDTILPGAAAGGLFTRPTFRVIAEREPEIVGSPNVIVNALTQALRDAGTGAGGGGGMVNSFTFNITALDGSDLRRKVEDDVLPIIIEAWEVNRNRVLTKTRHALALGAA